MWRKEKILKKKFFGSMLIEFIGHSPLVRIQWRRKICFGGKKKSDFGHIN